MITFQEIINRLARFWEKQGCIINQGYDLEVGAGTFNPTTFLRCLGPEPYRAAYVEPCRRPTDGRFGTNPNRLQHYFQFQVILKPSPLNMQELYLESLEAIGFNLSEHDIRFVHDDWESPTLGAWGLGWEVWMDGMEVTQYTYFQSVAGIALKPITGEVTYGIERLAMYLQNVNSIYDIQWNEHLKYGDIYQRNEKEWSHYNFEEATTAMWFRHFEDFEKEARQLVQKKLPIPAYDFVIKASHAFNMLDARGVISVTERTGYISRIRELSCEVAKAYIESRESQGFPLLGRFKVESAEEETHLVPITGILDQILLDATPEMKEDYVLEIGSEELPASFVNIACANLEKGVRKLLESEGIAFDEIEMYGTPRRITAYVSGLAMAKAGRSEERRGPPLSSVFDDKGTLTPAGAGFLRSVNKESISLDAVESGSDSHFFIKEVKGTRYLFALVESAGCSTAELLKERLPALILGMDFPKKMRWSDLDITYARPLRWIVSLFGDHVIPFTVGNIIAGRESYGHRQLHPRAFALVKAQDYLSMLREHKVLADREERRKAILSQIDEVELTCGGKAIAMEKVLPQVVNLVEWPRIAIGTFDSDFLHAPKEVLISEMVEHQKYFPVERYDGMLKNMFLITSDMKSTGFISDGNQRALSPRLADGVSLYQLDLNTPLEKFVEKLKQITFQKELGTVFDKVERLQKHVTVLQKMLQISTPALVTRAAQLSKADLASKMVYEFPDLQGTMGRYYAEAQDEPYDVAVAIEEQWMPRGENASLPENDTGIILSLADKIDNLIGCYCADLKPSSSSDPYALRRQTLAIIKILIENRLRLPLHEALALCFVNFPESIRKGKDSVLEEVEAFIVNRIKTVFLDYGVNKDEIEASLSSGFNDIYDSYCKVRALHHFRSSDKKFPLLYEVYKRAKGQLTNQKSVAFSDLLLQEKAEIALHEVLMQSQRPFDEALTAYNYDGAYANIAEMQPALARLFDEVKILAEEPSVRDNRIALLSRVFERFSKLLDFSKIQG